MTNRLHILLIDDNPDDRTLAIRDLKREFPDLDVEQASDSATLSSALASNRFDLAITDYQLRWTDGLTVLRAIKSQRPDCPVIMFTGTGSEEIAVEAMNAGLDDYVLKSTRQYARLPGVVRRVLDQAAQRRSLREAETRYLSLFNHLPIGLYKTAADGRIVDINPVAVQLLGFPSREALLSIPAADLYADPGERERWQALMGKDGVVRHFETRLRRFDGSFVTVEDNARAVRDEEGRILYYEGSLEDITERLNLELQLRQSQKMESVGQLAAGVAHDFNNILTVIKGHADLLLTRGELKSTQADSVRKISSASDRAANLTRQLLTFSRRQIMEPHSMDLNEVILNVAKMLERTLGEHIHLKFELSQKLPSIRADLGMTEQIIMNLAVNARDAMPGGGDLTVRTDVTEIGDSYVARNAEARPGVFVCLSVTDTGCGMDEAVLSRIFEPFFTTKEVGKGTGLGLATVYGITRLHNGWIEVASQVGKGSTFKVFVPATTRKPEAVADTISVSTEVRGGNETVLVVEDEPELRALARQVLENYGYRVLEAASGAAALRIWPQHAREIDLVLTDMVMPEGVSGWELAEKLQVQKPELKVICTSGYSMDLVNRMSRTPELPDGIRLLQKPFRPQALALAVRECLDRD
jgi:two-component system cell cycle sensor histidine kinase/response regulator CckA